MCVVHRPVLCMTSFLFPSPLANQTALSCSLWEGGSMCQRTTFRIQFSSVMGSGELRLSGLSQKLFSRWVILWSSPIFMGTRSVGTSIFCPLPRVEISTAISTPFLLREQESRPISRESVSAFQCMNVLADVFDQLRACFPLWLW